MPRPKTRPDALILEAALVLMQERGPEGLTFAALAERCRLSAATLVQRFGGKAALKQAALLHAWDQLDAETARLSASVARTPEGAIELLAGLSAQYGGIESYAEGLLLLREDLRDPALRARGKAWMTALSDALGACLAATPGLPAASGLLMATHWQGTLLWWSFDPSESVERHVETSLRRFLDTVLLAGG